jgi:hypothetical protein
MEIAQESQDFQNIIEQGRSRVGTQPAILITYLIRSIDALKRDFFHTIGDNGCQLHHMQIQLCVSLNVELDVITVGQQLLVQCHKFVD